MIDAKITFEQIPYVIADLARQVALLRDELKSKKEDINNYLNACKV